MKRILVVAAGLAVLTGCGDDDDDGGGGPAGLTFGRHSAGPSSDGPAVEFFDDFSGSFPAPNWEIRRGDPFVSPIVGNAEPALALRPFGERIRVRSVFAFSGEGPLTFSFDLSSYELQKSSRFKVRLRREDGGPETSLEAQIDDREFSLRIAGVHDDDPFTFAANEGGNFMPLKFVVDAEGSAAWWINGVSHMTGAFPPGMYRIEFDTTGGDRTKFVVDNVKLTRP